MKFKANHARAEAEIKAAWDEGDIDLARRLAHSIKGVSGSFGARELQAAARDLETAVIEGSTNAFMTHLHSLGQALNRVLSSVGHLESIRIEASPRPDSAGGREKVIDVLTIGPLIEELKGFLEEDDTRASKSLNSLKEHLGGSGLEPEISRLEELIGRYDFEAALEVLKGIGRSLDPSGVGTDR